MKAEESYKLFSQFYDGYADRFTADIPLYTGLIKPYSRILEVGCGTGRILQHLVDKNRRVIGVDVSQEMLDKAAPKLRDKISSGRLKLLNHDFSEGPIEEKSEAALITWYTFNYVLDNPLLFLKNIAASLEPRGLLVMDLFYPQTFTHPERDKKLIKKDFLLEGLPVTVEEIRTVKKDVEVRIQKFRTENETVVIESWRKYYSKTRLSTLLRSAGFTGIEFIDSYDMTTRHSLKDNETTADNFICLSRNGSM